MDSGVNTCLITGGSAGIGLATAKRFVEEGFNVSICGRRNDVLEKAVKSLSQTVGPQKIMAIGGDVAEQQFRNRLIAETESQFGSIDVLVNNAGVAPMGELTSVKDSDFENVLDVNVRAAFSLSKMVWPIMINRGGGTIVNISSMAAVDPFPGFSIYGASKAWLELFTKSIAAEGAEHAIRVCCVRPGAVETELLRGLFPDFPADQCVGPEEVAEKVWQCVEMPTQHPSGDAFAVAKV